jgi:methylated-DNA-[protein]-cysteine S-methyltransferase
MSKRTTGKTDQIEQALRRGRTYTTDDRPAGPRGRARPANGPAGRRAEDRAGAAARRLKSRIAAQGLADVTYGAVDSPFGRLLLAATKRGLVRVAFPEESVDATLDRLAMRISPRIIEAPGALDAMRRELDEYFGGRRHRFELPLDWTLVGPFGRRVLDVTSDIPYGGVLSYAQVAAQAGSPRGSRAAGNALGSNPIPIVVPCHRVLRSGGALGGYGGGLKRKQFLLELEGAL